MNSTETVVCTDGPTGEGRQFLARRHPRVLQWLEDFFVRLDHDYNLAFWALLEQTFDNGNSWLVLRLWLEQADDEALCGIQRHMEERFWWSDELVFEVEPYPTQPVMGTDFMEWQYFPSTQCLPTAR